MNTPRVLWHLMRADFLERVRRHSFLVTLALAVGLGDRHQGRLRSLRAGHSDGQPASGGQLPAVWLSGVILAMATGGALAVRLATAGDWAGFGGWAVGALFIPTLALVLGVWSGSGKVFEAVYLLLWYVGPLNRTAALGTAAVLGRRRQLQMR